MKPIMQNPIAVATAIFWNSEIIKKGIIITDSTRYSYTIEIGLPDCPIIQTTDP
jgi:hypothetical protein